MNKTDHPIEKKMFDYSTLISDNDNEGTWIIIGISVFMLIIAIWIIFF